jgi:hypothetical protein
MGHSFAGLADEYTFAGNDGPCSQQDDCLEANATLRTQRDQIKWKDWIDAATPLPTPPTQQYQTVLGLFEGARYQATGTYRPAFECKMRDLGNDYCPICAEQLVRSIWTAPNIKMIESTTPAQPNVPSASCDPIALSVTTPPITPSTYRYVWSVDGKPQLEMSNAIQLLPSQLMLGDHKVDVAIQDATALVRTDPGGVLKDQFSWTVSVAKSDCPVVVGGAAGAGGAAAVGGVGGMLAGTGGSSAPTTAGGMPGAAGVATGGGSAVGGSAPGSGVAPGQQPSPPPQESPGCSCSVPGRRAASEAAPFAAMILAGMLGRRRRALKRR